MKSTLFSIITIIYLGRFRTSDVNIFSIYELFKQLDHISTLRNELSDRIVTKVVTITEGTTSSRTSSAGGSSSDSISAIVWANLKSIVSADLGYCKTTGFDWSYSSTSSFSREESHQARIPVKPGDEVSVYQVVGICDNSDGTVYTVNTKTLVIRGKDGTSTEVVPEWMKK